MDGLGLVSVVGDCVCAGLGHPQHGAVLCWCIGSAHLSSISVVTPSHAAAQHMQETLCLQAFGCVGLFGFPSQGVMCQSWDPSVLVRGG